MKKTVLSLVLVVAMLMSCVCTVGAAGGGGGGGGAITPGGIASLDDLKVFFESATDGRVSVPGDITIKKATSEYVDELEVTETEEFSAKAMLDMWIVKYHVQNVRGELANNTLRTALDAKAVTGEFNITVNIGAGVYVIPEAAYTENGMAGFNDGAKDLFEEVDISAEDNTYRTITGNNSTGHTIKVKVKVKDGKKVGNLLSEIPDEINFTYGGLKAVADTTIGGSIEGFVDVEGLGRIDFDFYDKPTGDIDVAIKPAFVDLPALPGGDGPNGGGGGGVTEKVTYTVKYETDGGTTYKEETYAENKEIKVDKVPEKEGYIFDGWYLDADFTVAAEAKLKVDKNITFYAKWLRENHPVPGNLNGEDHYAYVIGYPDGTVRPDANITRAEVTTIFFRLLKDAVRDENLTNENVFDDVNEDDWHNIAISTMAKLGIVNGRSENEFVPDANITRAEFTAICARFDDTEVEYTGKFKDIAGHWAEEYIKRACAYGWIEGYSDNTFRPDRFITRAEAMTLINRVLNRILENVDALIHDEMNVWTDNTDSSEWYYTAVQEATHSTEYESSKTIYKVWTKVIENRDWLELESSLKIEEPDVTEDAAETEETDNADAVEEAPSEESEETVGE